MAETGQTSSQQFPSTYPLAPAYDNSSASSTASLQGPYTPGAGMIIAGPTGRPSSGPNVSHSHQIALIPGSELRPGGYNYPYESVSSSGLPVSGYSDFIQRHGSGPGSPIMSHAHLSSVGLQAQKRAYRQRRKDPSCDACRERKVKCDATDTTSCSECSSRNVKCQFTKETNRRMSSIKQVQDLEKQLAHARQQLSHLRSTTREGDFAESEAHHHSTIQIQSNQQEQHTINADLANVQPNLRRYGRGIFKPPQSSSQLSLSSSPSSLELPELPPKHVADDLLRWYHDSFHPTLPIIHWPSFMHKYEEVYRDGSLKGATRIWSALLFAVFGCSNLNRSWKDCQSFLETSKTLLDVWTEDLTLDHVRSALLASIVLVEMNLKSAGWTWLGCAIRISQDIGLHRQTGTRASVDEETKKRIWWSLYSCDRSVAFYEFLTKIEADYLSLLSLELGRPAMINDEECDVGLPNPVDDRYLSESGGGSQRTESLVLPTIQVMCGISKLLKTLRTPNLNIPTLQSYDSLFIECIAAFPSHHQVRSDGYLDPHSLPPLIYLQSARLMLHRQNLTTACPFDVRAAAVQDCVNISHDTVRLLARCMQDPPETLQQPLTSHDKWEARLASATSAFFCTHVWRCTLFLCFRGDYDAALLCARASAAIADVRPVNTACGRYLDFFLRRLTSKLQQGEGAHLSGDEEMIAYLSGDLQGSIESSWVWQGWEGEGEMQLSEPLNDRTSANGQRADDGAGNADVPEEGDGWAEWDVILETLERLMREQQQVRQHRMAHGIPPQVQQEPMQITSSASQATSQVSPGSSSRISIANII